MSSAALKPATRDIRVDEVFSHTAEMMWKTLTTPELMGRWLMVPTGFEPVVGNHFTYQTTPAGEWDGIINCEVLEAVPNERLVYTWQGGNDANSGYGSRLDTVVAWTLTRAEGGTRVRLVHSGFQAPNDVAFRNMSDGWPKVVQMVAELAREYF
ncbi:MAG: SRPBCC domain-containing protein [Sphingomonas sp.]|uniref:SRPBCC family protein n=1 Tax=Sphingomonas sp. TaxID=28214 RepID=UPI0017C4839B|nr:SRPBCC domain-containing protein [Sphingomonas sp.]MBA3667448.1 SRPBCC domain-containing protein [Sphingomonas sp.]